MHCFDLTLFSSFQNLNMTLLCKPNLSTLKLSEHGKLFSTVFTLLSRSGPSIALRSRKRSKSSEEILSHSKFKDCQRVRVKGGDGGNGSISLASVFAKNLQVQMVETVETGVMSSSKYPRR